MKKETVDNTAKSIFPFAPCLQQRGSYHVMREAETSNGQVNRMIEGRSLHSFTPTPA